MSADLFDEFDEVSAKQWKQKIQFELKGEDFNDTLVWKSLEGINVKPFYHADDFEGEFPKIPGQPTQWDISQQLFIDDAAIANRIALDAIARGAEAIYFTAEKDFDYKKVFDGFPFENTAVHFDLKFLSEDFLQDLITFLNGKNARVYYNVDIIGHHARSGNWFHNLKRDHDIVDKILHSHPKENLLCVDASLYQNAGATMVQQLAYALAQANEYLNHISSGTVPSSAAESVPSSAVERSLTGAKITFRIAIGSNYFFEIAKIRALRKLYAVLASEYGLPQTCHITAFPSKRNKTIYDYNVNMLRTTTECMSAVLGGANTVCNLPYDALYHKSNEFGERISRNQLLILKAEGYFESVGHAADGAYYIENLCMQLAEKALLLFKELEASGGFLKALKEGQIQKKIKESAEKEQQLFDKGELVLVGTNKHPNKAERMQADLELYPFVKTRNKKTLMEPIIEKRLAEKTEKERLENEGN